MLKRELDKIEADFAQAREELASANRQSSILEDYVANMKKDSFTNFGAYIETYREQRAIIHALKVACEKRIHQSTVERGRQKNAYEKATKDIRLKKRKAEEAERKKRDEKWKAHQEKHEAKKRLRSQRLQFWPKKVFRVTLTIDTPDMTPASSRRNSLSSLTTLKAGQDEASVNNPLEIALSLYYITTSAWWKPRYDLTLNTVENAGLIVYRAEFGNTTSETWKDTKATSSTSQTSFQGLGEPIPKMQPWHIKLLGNTREDDSSGPIKSDHEIRYNNNYRFRSGRRGRELRNRDELFELGAPRPASEQSDARYVAVAGVARFCDTRDDDRTRGSHWAAQDAEDDSSDMDEGFGGGDYDHGRFLSNGPATPPLAEPESSWSESGLTTSYDIPGLRTIAPSNNKRRQRVASIPLSGIIFGHLIVSKLRPVAFLRARITNRSSLTLLKGPVGLTLDGSFLGNTTIPRCSAGEVFDLNLGVEPGINVSYAQPVVKRSQIGVFTKDKHEIYTRACTIMNTKARPIEGIVLDQIPLSEDERLRVEVLQPVGLREGYAVKSGVPLTEVKKWGRANATLRRGGEVAWEVKLEPGKGVRLVLEYETKFPGGDSVSNAGSVVHRGACAEEDELTGVVGFGLFD